MDDGDRPCFPSSSESDLPAEMSRFCTDRGNSLFCHGSSFCRDMKSLVTPNSWNAGSPLHSSWIQRLIPESISHGLDHSRNADLRTGDQSLIYLSRGKEKITEPSCRGDLVEQWEGDVFGNNDAGIFPLGDLGRRHMLNNLDAATCKTSNGISEEPFVNKPEAFLCPIQLPTVESLLPGYIKKGNEREVSLKAKDGESLASSSNGTRQSNGTTLSAHLKRNCADFAVPGRTSDRKSLSGAYHPYLVPDSSNELRPASGFRCPRESSLGIGGHYCRENRNIVSLSVLARGPISGGRSCHVNEPVSGRKAYVSETRTLDNQEPSNIKLGQNSFRIDGTVSNKNCQCVGPRSFFPGDRLKSVHSARGCGGSVLLQDAGRHTGARLGTRKNLEALACETKHLHRWKSHFSELNAASKSDVCARTEKGKVSDVVMLMPTPRQEAVFSAQSCDVNGAKPPPDSVMASRCAQLELCTSHGSKLLETSAFRVKGMLREPGLDTGGIRWPFPLASDFFNSTQQQHGNFFGTTTLRPDLCAELLPSNKFTETNCNCPISEKQNRGEVRSVIDFIQPCSQSLDMDGSSEGEVACYWQSHQKFHTDDVQHSCDMQHCFRSTNDSLRNEIESPICKKHQEQNIRLISGLAVLSRPEFGTGIRLAKDGELEEYKYGIGETLKHKNLVSHPPVHYSTWRCGETKPMNCVFLKELQNASAEVAKLKTAASESEPLLRDASINFEDLVELSKPAAVGHLNVVKCEMQSDRYSKMKNDECEDGPSMILGKRSRVEGLQVPGSVCQTAFVDIGLDVDRSSMGGEFCSKPKMWIQRWCSATSGPKPQNSLILDKESVMSVVNNGKPHSLQAFNCFGDSIFQDKGYNTFCETQKAFVLPQSENHKRRCNLHNETTLAVSGLSEDAIKRRSDNNKGSHFMKRLFAPSAAAMAVIGTTARQIHATKPQKTGLFGIWSLPKDLRRQASEPLDVAFNFAGSKPELTKGFMQSPGDYSVTPASS